MHTPCHGEHPSSREGLPRLRRQAAGTAEGQSPASGKTFFRAASCVSRFCSASGVSASSSSAGCPAANSRTHSVCCRSTTPPPFPSGRCSSASKYSRPNRTGLPTVNGEPFSGAHSRKMSRFPARPQTQRTSRLRCCAAAAADHPARTDSRKAPAARAAGRTDRAARCRCGGAGRAAARERPEQCTACAPPPSALRPDAARCRPLPPVRGTASARRRSPRAACSTRTAAQGRRP